MKKTDITIILVCSVSLFQSCYGQWGVDNDPQWDETEKSRKKRQAGHIWPEANPDRRYPGNKYDPYCGPNDPWPCFYPPYYPYDPILKEIPNIGTVVGRSWIYRDNIVKKYLNIYLGIPYARMPIGERRFKPPEDCQAGWDLGYKQWDASFYRDACPQQLWHNDRYNEARNMSENCLHLNVFQPNLTGRDPPQKKYKVMVIIQGDDFVAGDSMMTPGHVLAEKEMIVVTLNYRLGALGFLSTMDTNAKGNYGLMDILKALEWVQNYIHLFDGLPNEVTLVGIGSGAAAVSLLMLSPHSTKNNQYLFHQAILMSGSDLCEWSFVDKLYLNPIDRSDPLEYAKDLGRQSGCDPDYGLSNQQLIDCLRRKHYDEIVNATGSVYKKYGSLSGPFGPVVDGMGGILPKEPLQIRQDGDFMKIKVIAGFNKDEGAFLVENVTKDIVALRISDGLDPGTFRDILMDMVRKRSGIRNIDETVNAMEFEYTFWAKPDNKTAVRQNLIDLYSDMLWGSCIDTTLKYHAAYDEPVWMYVFTHRSELEVLPQWMGTPRGKDVEYLFGAPYLNETLGNITGIIPYQWDWTYLDKNITQFMQDMWANFTKYNNPTSEWARNVTWYPFALHNLSYLHIGGDWSYMDINYRQSHFAFWRDYFPVLSSRLPITTTPFPTPHPLIEYQVATWSLVGTAVITVFILGALGITLWRRTKGSSIYD